MQIRQTYRLLTFGYACFLPNILSFWVYAILPEILVRNLGVVNKEEISADCGYFFSNFYWGIIIGAFIWPSVMLYVSKKNAVLSCLIGMCFFNYLVGASKNLRYVYLFRFLCGMFHNLNSVGKDFIYQFAKPRFRLYSFTIKTFFTIIAGFIGPFFGYFLYVWCDKDFQRANNYINLFFVIGIFFFILVFYFDFTPGDIGDGASVDEEERTRLKDEGQENFDEQKGIFHVLKICMKDSYLRNLIIVYFLTNGVYKTSTMLSIIYLETPWIDQGYGIDSSIISIVSMLAFIPSAILLLTSPSFVPSRISYKAFIEFFIVMLGLAILLFPIARDLIPENGHDRYSFIPLVLLGFLFGAVPKVYSPFINLKLNDKVDKYCRTSLNSITFLASTLSAASFATFVFPLLGWSIYNPIFEGKVVYSKYIAFIALDIGSLFAFVIVKKIQ